MNTLLQRWLPAFAPAGVLAFLFAAPTALSHWDQPIRTGDVTVALLPLGWLVFASIFTLISYRDTAGEPERMRDRFKLFGAAALFGFLAVVPFAFLEFYSNPRIRSGEFAFPFGLFHGMWLFPTMLFLAATTAVSEVHARKGLMDRPFPLVLRVGFLTLVTAGWLSMLWDQMPCFLGGVPGCD